MRSLLVVALAATAAIAACTPKKPAAIEINERRLEMQVLELRETQMRLLQPEMTRGQIAAGLVEGWVAAEVLTAHGKGLKRDELIAERAKLESNQKIARLYREVARVYGENRDAFLNVGLLPDIALRRAHELYVRDSAGAEETEARAAKVLRATQEAPELFEQAAQEAGAELQTIAVALDGTVHDAESNPVQLFAPTQQADREAATKLYGIGQNSQAEAVLGLVLKTGGGYMLLKRLEPQGEKIGFLAAFFPRQSFGQWLAQQAELLQDDGKLRVCLSEELRTHYDEAAISNLVHCP